MAPFSHICPPTFPQNVAWLWRQHFIRCGNCPSTLQDLFFSVKKCFFFLVSVAPQKTQDKSSLSSSQLVLTVSIHFIYFCPESLGCLLNRGRSCSRSQDAVCFETLCFLFIGCHDSFLFRLWTWLAYGHFWVPL